MKLEYKDCVVLFKDKSLTLENKFLKRSIDFSNGIPVTKSFINIKTGFEFVDKESVEPDIALSGLTHWQDIKFDIENIESRVVKSSVFDGEHLLVEVVTTDPRQHLKIRRLYRLYPALPVVSSQFAVTSGVTPGNYWNGRIKKHFIHRYAPKDQENRVEGLSLVNPIKPYKSIEFRGITDFHNEMVIEHDIISAQALGNILLCGNASRANGLFILQEAPVSSERRDQEPYDFRLEGNYVASCGSGFCPWDYHEYHELIGFRHTIGFFEGDFEPVLKSYQQRRYPDCKYQVMANPWGTGNFPNKVTEEFLVKEIRAAAELGCTEYQVDDGWQAKRVLTTMSLYNEYIDLQDWKVNQKLLPDSLRPLVDVAREANIELALWVAPTFTREYRDWREFTDLLMEFYNKYNIRIFKIDSVRLRSREAYENFHNMVHSLRERSNGNIIFNFDNTNGQRTGYFTFLEYGNIFLENRYVNSKSGKKYHPESTLRNFWKLSHYVRLQKFQVEAPNPGDIIHEFYRDSSISGTLPDAYPPEYWLALAMFSNPLLWLAPSELCPETLKAYRKIIDLHLTYRDAIFEGEIYPVGMEPDGKALTGFQAHSLDTGSGFLIIYREFRGPSKAEIKLKFILEHKVIFESLSDNNPQKIKEPGCQIEFELETPASFRLYKYKIIN